MAKAILNGNEIFGNVHIGGGSGKNIVFHGSSTTNKWAEPIEFTNIDIDDYEIVRFMFTDEGTSYDIPLVVSNMVISSNIGIDENYNKLSTNVYVYKSASGGIYVYVSTNKTLVLTDVIAYA